MSHHAAMMQDVLTRRGSKGRPPKGQGKGSYGGFFPYRFPSGGGGKAKGKGKGKGKDFKGKGKGKGKGKYPRPWRTNTRLGVEGGGDDVGYPPGLDDDGNWAEWSSGWEQGSSELDVQSSWDGSGHGWSEWSQYDAEAEVQGAWDN